MDSLPIRTKDNLLGGVWPRLRPDAARAAGRLDVSCIAYLA